MKIRLIDEVKYLIAGLSRAGFAAWAVGGCVRDSLLGRDIHDWDVCTSATPAEMELALAGERIYKTGMAHGTLTVVVNGVPIETTTLRSDGEYADHRRPDSVRFVTELSDDLKRRDFTINAMAYSDADGFVDLFSGAEDLKRGVIRCVGSPKLRFGQDALRILRAVRFASQLDFAIDGETARAGRDMRFDLRYVSKERIFGEVKKLLEGKAAGRVIRENDEIVSAALGVERIDLSWKCLPGSAETGLALLTGKDGASVARELRADNITVSRVANVCRWLDRAVPNSPKEALEFLRDAKSDRTAFDMAEIWRCRGIDFDIALLEDVRNRCHRVSDLAIGGDDLKTLGYSGVGIGRELEKLLNQVVEGVVANERQELTDAARLDISAFQ